MPEKQIKILYNKIKFTFKRKACPVLEVKLPSIVCRYLVNVVFFVVVKYLIGMQIPEQKPWEMTSQNCNLIGYSTHMASFFIMRDIKKIHRKVMFIIFTKIFHNLTNNYS